MSQFDLGGFDENSKAVRTCQSDGGLSTERDLRIQQLLVWTLVLPVAHRWETLLC